jgi:hypothetical protein
MSAWGFSKESTGGMVFGQLSISKALQAVKQELSLSGEI